jgi:hypothetical protein
MGRAIVNHKARAVRCLDTGEVFKTIAQAAEKYGLPGSCISDCCRGVQKTAGGLRWEYVTRDWSTLEELSAQYRESAKLLRVRMAELRKALAQTDDPDEAWHIKRRLAALTPMLTEMNELAELAERYYERGFYRDDRYTVNGIGRGPEKKAKASKIDANCAGGTYRDADGYSVFVCYGGAVTGGRGERKRRKQVHGLPDPKARDGEDAKNSQVSVELTKDQGARLLSAFDFRKE